ncbi:head morphogenesis [Vibrio phage D479]
MKAYAQGEQVIIDTNAKSEGEELKSAGGIVLGTLNQGEVPLHGKVISVGGEVDQDIVSVGDIVLLPQGHIKNVPDPRIIAGQMEQTDTKRVKWVHTHYKNIAVVYKSE